MIDKLKIGDKVRLKFFTKKEYLKLKNVAWRYDYKKYLKEYNKYKNKTFKIRDAVYDDGSLNIHDYYLEGVPIVWGDELEKVVDLKDKFKYVLTK